MACIDEECFDFKVNVADKFITTYLLWIRDKNRDDNDRDSFEEDVEDSKCLEIVSDVSDSDE